MCSKIVNDLSQFKSKKLKVKVRIANCELYRELRIANCELYPTPEKENKRVTPGPITGSPFVGLPVELL